MPGNSERRGATRKPGSKKGATVGSGGRGRRGLEGKGPTPKAEDRPYHPAHERKARAGAGVGAGAKQGPRAPRGAPDGAPRGAQGGAPRGPRRSGPRSGTGAGGPEIVAGRNPVVEALRAGVKASAFYVMARIENDDRVSEALALAAAARVEVREVSRSELDGLTDRAVHQGLALAVAPFRYAELGDLLPRESGTRAPIIIALDGVQDPRNLGAILRSAVAFGASGAVIPERRAASVTVAAWKSSAGAAARLPVARVTNLARAIEDLKRERLFVVGLDADGDVPIGECDLLDGAVVLVVGSEGKGLSRLVREACDQVASIPIASATESLNASVAASLALYEASRRRGVTGP